MNRMPESPIALFRKSLKSDSFHADELINIYLLRPLAGLVVWILYPLPVTPNQVTVAAVIAGCGAAVVYYSGTAAAVAAGGVLIVLKDILDDADGQLARAKQLYSRRGRFLDSIGDFVVDVAVFFSITAVVLRDSPTWYAVLGLLGLAGITLRVSYHVFYQVSFLHREQRYNLNRLTEELTDEDLAGDPIARGLQRIFLVIYGWQDRLMVRIDRWCIGGRCGPEHLPVWYSDRFALRCSGLLGFGTEIMLLGICSWCNDLKIYLWLNLVLMNGIWLFSIAYRKVVLARNLAS